MLQIAIVVNEILLTMLGRVVLTLRNRKYAESIWIITTAETYRQYPRVENLWISINTYSIVIIKLSNEIEPCSFKIDIHSHFFWIFILNILQSYRICDVTNIIYIILSIHYPSTLCFQYLLTCNSPLVSFH